MAKFCENCGAPLVAGDKFCASCGSAVAQAQQPVYGQAAPTATEAQRPVYGQAVPQAAQTQQPVYGQAVPPAGQTQRPIYGKVNPPAVQTRQSPYTQAAPTAAPPKKKKKKGCAVAVLALLLILVLVTGFIKPGFFIKSKKEASLINTVEVFIPNPTGPEAIAGLMGNLALQYYIEARLYLEKLSAYDLEDLDPEAFVQLVSDTVVAFENAEKASKGLARAVDLWMACDDVRTAPSYKVTRQADEKAQNNSPLLVNAFAAGYSRAEVRAEDIVAAFDKAKNGEKIKAIATLLGTDAKHAMAELKVAQAELEKRGYDKIADQADTCVKVAKTLKTAGTIAGCVVGAMPLATGAVATMATGELLVTGTGVVVSAVNTGLEVVSTGAMYYYGTDQNQVTESADAIADSKFMQTVNIVTGVASVGYNIKNLIEKADMNNLTEYLTSLSTNNGKEGSDVFGLLSFGLSNLDNMPSPHTEAASTALKTLVTITTHTEEDGLLIKIEDTLMGDDEKKWEAAKEMLDSFKIPTGARSVLESAVSLFATGEEPSQPPETDPAEPMPAETVEQLLAEREDIAPGSGTFDLDAILDMAEGFLLELSLCEPPSETQSETAEAAENTETTGTPGETGTSAQNANTSLDAITGYYKCTGIQKDNMGDEWETEDVRMSFNITVNDAGKLVWASGYGEYYDEQILLFDASTGAYRYSDNWDDVANEPSWFTEYGSFTFYQENGVKKVRVQIQQVDNEFGTVESVWTLEGAAE